MGKKTVTKKERALTAKQDMFCKEYLVDLNRTQAAIRAGYSPKTAEVIAYQLLQKTLVSTRIQELMDKRSNRLEITAENVLKELARIGFADMKRFTRWGESGVTLIDSSELTEDDTAAVSEVSQTVTESGGSIKFKLHDKKGALDSIGKHLKLFNDVGSKDNPLTVQPVILSKEDAAL